MTERRIIASLLVVLLFGVLAPAALAQPMADFIGTPTSGEVPLTVEFTNLSTGHFINSWSFGDGLGSGAENPTHTFDQPGSFTVTLVVTSLTLQQDTETKLDYVVVVPQPLLPDFSVDVPSGTVAHTAAFQDQTGGGPAESWLWDFGDGGSSTAKNPVHVYDVAGTYTVSLTVDSLTEQVSVTKRDLIEVLDAPLQPSFSISEHAGVVPFGVDFTDTSTGANPTGWDWDFGDGTTSTQPQPTHVYETSGLYDVTLTLTLAGDSASALVPGAVATFAPVSFLPQSAIAVGSSVRELLLGDLNGDGVPDAVTANAGSQDLSVLLGEPSGSLGTPTSVPLPGSPSDFDLGDLDLDGDLDAVVAGDLGGRGLLTFLGDGSGGLLIQDQLAAPSMTLMAVGDVDGDGLPDAVRIGGTVLGSELQVFPGDGNGNLTASSGAWDLCPDGIVTALALADVNGDGSLDALTGCEDSWDIAWRTLLTSTPTGFDISSLGGYYASEIRHADMNDDGIGDWVWSVLDSAVFETGAAISLGNGTGFESAFESNYHGNTGLGITTGDMDGDGFTDAVTSGIETVVFLGTGGTTLGEEIELGLSSEQIDSADLDADGRADLVITQGADSVSALLNRSLPDGFLDLQGSLAGAAGAPTLSASGSATPGGAISLALTNAAPLAPAWLVLGLTRLSAPFKGGSMVPDADLILGPLSTDTNGAISLPTLLDPTTPTQVDLFMQWWIQDAGGPVGFSASNGLLMVVLDG